MEFDISKIFTDLGSILLCKNHTNSEEKIMCHNSVGFVKFIADNSDNKSLQNILKYFIQPEKYKFTNFFHKKLHASEPLLDQLADYYKEQMIMSKIYTHDKCIYIHNYNHFT